MHKLLLVTIFQLSVLMWLWSLYPNGKPILTRQIQGTLIIQESIYVKVINKFNVKSFGFYRVYLSIDPSGSIKMCRCVWRNCFRVPFNQLILWDMAWKYVQKWRENGMKKMWNMFKVNNKGSRTTPMSLWLTLNTF